MTDEEMNLEAVPRIAYICTWNVFLIHSKLSLMGI